MPVQFDRPLFESALETRSVGRELVCFETVETTMTIARDLAVSGAPHGTLVLAEEQTAGRGRRGRSFFSPPGENLYFTLVLRLGADEHRRLPIVVPLAVCEAVRAEGIDARIKWPNDIWVGERKLCGMLIDAEARAEGLIAYPGIGINVNADPTLDPALAFTATSLAREVGRNIAREPLLARISNLIESLLTALPDEVSARYRDRSMLIGRDVMVQPQPGEPFEARATGIDDDGALVVTSARGEERLLAADVSVRPLG
jgi:BirA family biotin operon repressor/biotin-[acetyl-CoA-carboxylase] ligase